MSTTDLLEAIRVVKENERIARDSYADAATIIRNPLGRELFKQLTEFEQFHYEKLSDLEKSLEESGDFIDYEGRGFLLPPIFEIEAAKELDQKSVIKIVIQAQGQETRAEKAYADLADQIANPKGHQMFFRLSVEEHNHYLALREAYWALSNLGVWRWSRP